MKDLVMSFEELFHKMKNRFLMELLNVAYQMMD